MVAMCPLVAVCRRVSFIIDQTIFKNTNSRKTVAVCLLVAVCGAGRRRQRFQNRLGAVWILDAVCILGGPVIYGVQYLV